MKQKLLTIISIILIVAGVFIFGFIGCSYYFIEKTNENLIESFDKVYDEINQNNSHSSNNVGNNNQESKNGNDNNSSNNSEEGKGDSQNYYSYSYDNGSQYNKPNGSTSKSNINVNQLREDSIKYNKALEKVQSSKLVSKKSYSYVALNLSKYGIYNNMYGYISAPKIGLNLPIFLGGTESSMSNGAAHLCYTSLPTGSNNTNVVLASHSGYLGRWLFDSLPNLTVGDKVIIKTYFNTFNYKVSKVLNRDPTKGEVMYIEKGKEKLTLITCVPSPSGGFQRRVVVCER